MLFCCILYVVLPIPACSSAERSARHERKAIKSMEALDDQIRLKPGDLISLRLVEADARAFFYTVSKTGEIDCPFLGMRRVTGLTPRQLAFKLKAEYAAERSQTVTVIVKLDDARNYYCIRSPRFPAVLLLMGGRPGKFELREGEVLTVSALLDKAGGHTSKRSVPKITIRRSTLQGRKYILVNTKAVLIDKNNDYDLFLRPDDLVIVE